VHAFAEALAQKLQFGVGSPIEPLVSRLGGRIEYKNPVGFETKLPESIVVRSMSDFTVYVPTMTSLERDKFTIAHELGHLFLHYPLVQAANSSATMVATRWVNENDEAQKRAEWEANWFAAAFLMGGQDFRRVYQQKNGNIDLVASMFGVSVPAAEIRKSTLNL
jgi:Zn-dependent peptidase ImmA (M78 family)